MGTIHEINHPYHPFGGPFMEPPISFFCGASILRSRLWVIKKSTRWGGSCRNSGHQLEIFHRNPRKTTKNKSSKTVSSKKKSKHQSNQSVNSFSVFPKKSDKLLIFSAAFAIFGSGESCAFRCLDPWQRRVRRASSTCCHPQTLIQSLGISTGIWMFFFTGCFESMDVFQWELGIFKGILNLDCFFQWIRETFHILHWDYHGCSTEIPKFSKRCEFMGILGLSLMFHGNPCSFPRLSVTS